MKIVSLIITAVFILTVFPVFAETIDESNKEAVVITNLNKPFITLNYGATASWLTRIIEQTGRSNFVLKDFLPGLFLNAEMQNISYFSPAIRAAAYYPLISSFNNMPQLPKTPLHFAVDLFAGMRFKKDWKFLTLSGGPGLHMLFMTADRWNYLNLGFAAAVGFELAITSKWSLLIDGFASIDNGNLGANKQMEPFDVTYQYQTAIGVRYSKKKRNNLALIMPKTENQAIILNR